MASTRALTEQKVCELTPKTKLKKKVIHSLVEVYNHKSGDKGLDRATFRDYIINNFGILDDVILDRLYHSIDRSSNNQGLSVDDFVLGVGSLLTDDIDELSKFCFKVYDSTGDGIITREKMYPFLKNALVTKSHDHDADDADEGIRELIELTVKKLDTDGDGRVSFEDFRSAVLKDKLRLELLGKCLPDDKNRYQCLKMLGDPDLNMQRVTITSAKQDGPRYQRRHSACTDRQQQQQVQTKQ